MSELKVDKVSPRTGNYVALNTVGMKNIIINGDMSIAQRGTSATGLGNGDSGYHTCDRWRFNEVGTVTFEFTQSQSTDVPSGQGFANSLKMDCTTADASLGSNHVLRIQHRIEGQNLQYLKKGTANAESVTFSFWVKSNKTGTYIVQLYDNDNNRTISNSYTINSASTWEKKTLTYVGDTTGAFDNDNSESLAIQFYLAAGTDFNSGTLNTSWNTPNNPDTATGQVNLADNTANEWYITGVQLEAGTTASDFEFLPHDVNKNRCLRYYYVHAEGNIKQIALGGYYNSTYITCALQFPQEMRVAPSLVKTTGTNYYGIYRDNTIDDFNDFDNGIQNPTTTSCGMDCTTNVSGTSGYVGRIITRNASSLIAFNSEL
jgi:hypothetical protein